MAIEDSLKKGIAQLLVESNDLKVANDAGCAVNDFHYQEYHGWMASAPNAFLLVCDSRDTS